MINVATSLNNYMRNTEDRRILANQIPDVAFYRMFAKNFNNNEFVGNNVEILLKTKRSMRGKAHGENLDLPSPGAVEYQKMLWPLAELITTAGVTKQAIDRATGGQASWGNIVEDALDDLDLDFEYLKCISAYGTGKGILGIVGDGSTGDPAVESGGIVTVKVDSTYTDTGVENVAHMREGMLVEVYSADGNTKRTANGGVEVLSVTFGNRKNGVPTYGTFTFAAANDCSIADGDIVYIHGAKSEALTRPLPTGLMYWLQDGTHFNAAIRESQHYGLNRASYGALRARIYQAQDFGLASETPADGTPTFWGASVISDAIMDVKRGSGRGKVDSLMMCSDMGMCLSRINRTDSNIQVVVNTTKAQDQAVVPVQLPSTFIAPDGTAIPIEYDEMLPNNCIVGITTKDGQMHQKGSFDFLREYGEVWEPSRGDRKTNYEAPYGGYLQFTTDRCDNHFMIQDLRSDL